MVSFTSRGAILFSAAILVSGFISTSAFADPKVDKALKNQSKVNSKQAKLNSVQKAQISGLSGQYNNLNSIVAGLIAALGGQTSEGGRISISVPAGPQGLKGDKGDRGDRGETGVAGPQGAKGDKGDRGDRGDAGVAGPQGPAGVAGAAGATGATGPVGPTGATGAAGRDGQDFQENAQSIQVAATAGSNCGFIDVTEQCSGPFGCTITASYIRSTGTRRAYGDNYTMVYTQESGSDVAKVVSVIGGIRGAADANKSVGGSAATQQILAYDGIDNLSTLINSKAGCPASYNPMVPVQNGEGQTFMVPAQTSTSGTPAFTNPYHLTLKTGANFEAYLKVTAN